MSLVYLLIAVVVLLVLPVIFVIGLYNGLVQLRNRYKNAFAQIDVQLKRRYDLIPNLVETAKAFMTHERETLEAVIQARNMASSAREHAAAGETGAIQQLASADAGSAVPSAGSSPFPRATPNCAATRTCCSCRRN